MRQNKPPLRPESILYDVIRDHPALRNRIAELFGKKCLSCPSSKKETLAYTAFHKGFDPDEVVRELNQILGNRRKKG